MRDHEHEGMDNTNRSSPHVVARSDRSDRSDGVGEHGIVFVGGSPASASGDPCARGE